MSDLKMGNAVEKSNDADVDIVHVKGVLKTAIDIDDKAVLLEREVGTDAIYTIIALGTSVAQIASSFGMTIFETNYILKRTPEHRKQYMNALAFSLSEDSVKLLRAFSNATQLEIEENNAARFHSANIDRAMKILNQNTNEDTGNKVIVKNTVIIRDKDDVPELPEELKDVIEGEFDVDS